MSDNSWRSIALEIAAQIEAGILAPGTRIASGDQFAKERGINRNTAHRAIEELQRQGLVVRRQGSGTIVAERRMGSSRRIALLVDGYSASHNFPSGELLRGIQDRIGEDSSLLIADSKHDVDLENRQLKKLSLDSDGIIVYPTGLHKPSPALLSLLHERFPVVALDRVPHGVQMDAAMTDNRGATRRAVGELILRGHRKIGFLGLHKPQYSSVGERFQGYQDALVGAGMADQPDSVRWLPEDSDRTMPLFQQLVRDTLFALLHGKDPITALFCVEDQVGCAAVLATEKLALRLPEQLEIVSYSDWHPMSLRSPWNVHRLIQRKFEMGSAAADLLLNRITAPSRPYQTVRIDADFVVADANLQEALLSMTL